MALDITIDTNDIEKKLKKVADMRSMRPVVQTVLLDLVNELAVYPVQVGTKSGYVRTGNLGKSWADKITTYNENEIEGVVGNNTNYAPWVMSNQEIGGRGPQAKIHEGNWATVQDVAKRNAAKINKQISDFIDTLV